MDLFMGNNYLKLHRINEHHTPMEAMYVLTNGHVLSLIDLCDVMEKRGESVGNRVLLALDATETYGEAIHELFAEAGSVLAFEKKLEERLEKLKS